MLVLDAYCPSVFFLPRGRCPLTWTQGRTLMGSGTRKIGPGGHCRWGRTQLCERLVVSLPRWYVHEVEGQQEAGGSTAEL